MLGDIKLHSLKIHAECHPEIQATPLRADVMAKLQTPCREHNRSCSAKYKSISTTNRRQQHFMHG